MGDAVARVDDGASQTAVLHLAAGPAGGEGEHGLHGDVEAGAVERLKHDLGRVFARLRRVQGLWAQTAAR